MSLIFKLIYCFSICLTLQGGKASAQDLTLFGNDVFKQDGDSLPYRIMLPHNHQHSDKLPVIIFLHGSGERGADNQKQLLHGGSLFASDINIINNRAVVIFPQCPLDDYWARVERITDSTGTISFNFQPELEPTNAMRLLMGLIDEIWNQSWADTNRFYVGGLSMGAMGTYELLYRRPGRFAAAIAICGGTNLSVVQSFANDVPLWIFHGTDDPIVAVSFSEQIAETIKNLGGNPRLSLYEGVGHGSWENAFAEPELLNWLFSHKKQ